ncbi:MAG: class I SAM-dependent methyltransferase [Acidimicrobiales bacterium]
MTSPADRVEGWPAAAAFMGPAYLRYSSTKGTEQEVAFLIDAIGLRPGQVVLDVGCGPGRHANALGDRGLQVVGIDLAPAFVTLGTNTASDGAAFAVGDARHLPVRGRHFDAAICLCQGGFGLLGREDPDVLNEIAASVRPGGSVVFSAFSSYFMVRHLEETDAFDADAGVNREETTVKDASGGREATFPFETSCFTPRELRLLVAAAGLELRALWSTSPGDYMSRLPDLEHPEFLVVAGVPSIAQW